MDMRTAAWGRAAAGWALLAVAAVGVGMGLAWRGDWSAWAAGMGKGEGAGVRQRVLEEPGEDSEVLGEEDEPAGLAAAIIPPASGAREGQAGMLTVRGKEGQEARACPLEHTDVRATVTGNLARVVVTQRFANPYAEKIEAVYTFPLGAQAAVTDMSMRIGDRLIVGQIKPREEARQVYEQARQAGHVAALLDQERPNVFTQAVANIEPGKRIRVRITYTEPLQYADGVYSFVFPMVVGPRYIPGAPIGRAGTGWAPDTDATPDASKVTPPAAPQGTRAGHDIAVRVDVNAGAEIKALTVRQHAAAVDWPDRARGRAVVRLADRKEIPNRDFVLEFSTAGEQIADAVLAHTDKTGGYFMLLLQPPAKVAPSQVRSREMVFVLDTSGSMRGFPIETSKALMRRAVRALRSDDTFNLVTFSGETALLWPGPMPNTAANRAAALAFIDNLAGAGGTEMMAAIHACLGGPHDPKRVRVVAFLTDGYVGNDMEIIAAVKANASASRVFSFGIGRGVNRYLLDAMAREGRGEAAYVLSEGEAAKAAATFYDRINAPVLTDIRVDWGELAAAVDARELLPANIPDLFSAAPVAIVGRYRPSAGPLAGTITLRGNTGEGKFERRIHLALPAAEPGNKTIPPLWARRKVDDLMGRDLANIQAGKPDPAIKESIVGLGMNYRLMTAFTSFVAVEEKVVTEGGRARRVAVPVEMPQGVSHEGVFGDRAARIMPKAMYLQTPMSVGRGWGHEAYAPAPMAVYGGGSGGGGGAAGSPDTAGQAATPEAQTKPSPAELAARTLVAELQGLVGKLDAQGNYKAGKVLVRGGKVTVVVFVERLDAKAVGELAAAGFRKLTDSPGARMVVGVVDVKSLVDVACLANVRRVEPADMVE